MPDDAMDLILNTPFAFGLVAQGHVPTIERMLIERKSWRDIGRAIGWDVDTAFEHWNRLPAEQQAEIDRLRARVAELEGVVDMAGGVEWEIKNAIQFDGTIVWGHGNGIDFDAMAMGSQEATFGGLGFKVWPDRLGGNAKCSLYCTDTSLWYGKFNGVREARSAAIVYAARQKVRS